MARKHITKSEAAKLNKAVETLRSFCKTHSSCKGCPFKRVRQSAYDNPCKFGSFYPELWKDLEIKEVDLNDEQ